MAATDSLLSMTQSFMTPDLIQKFSGALGQPADKIQSGLKSVLPAFLMGVANKGSSSEGAESLIKMAKTPNVEGSEAVNGIFGNNLSTITTSLGASTGMSSSSITKMMGMIAPMVMGVIGKKVNQDGLNASGLMGFLGSQKSSLANMVPAGISNMFGFGAASAGIGAVAGSVKGAMNKATSFPTTHESTYTTTNKKKSIAPIALIAALVLGFLWWMTGRNTNKIVTPAARTTTVETPNNTVVTAPATTTTATVAKAADLGELGAFFKSGDMNELPKRFSFQNLNFATGTSTLAAGAVAELDQIAAAMKENPASTARIEGFTDDTGDAAANLSLSSMRADTVKQELVSRNIDAGRIEAVGRGAESPIAENTTLEGRAQNRRIEFIVTGL